MTMTVRLVAPHFTPATSRPGSHFVSHATELSIGFQTLDHPVELLIPQGQNELTPPNGATLHAVLDTSSPATIVASVATVLSDSGAPNGLTLLYEGGLRYLHAFISLATSFPSERFALNLLDRDPGLTVETLGRIEQRQRLATQRGRVPESIEGTLPPNLILLADTAPRKLLAEGAGLPVDGVWQLHSQLAAHGDLFRPAPIDAHPKELRVLLPLSTWNAEPVLEEIGFAALRAPELLGSEQRITWTLSGNLDRIVGTAKVARLARTGVTIDHHVRPLDAYAQLFTDHDLVWLPMRRDCSTQSSGKATDALAMGRPILAPAGSIAAREQARWLPDFPDYRKAEEIPATMSLMFGLVPAALERLQGNSHERHDHYLAASSAAHVMDTVARAEGERGARRFRLPRASFEEPAPPDRTERLLLRARALTVGARTRRRFPRAHRT